MKLYRRFEYQVRQTLSEISTGDGITFRCHYSGSLYRNDDGFDFDVDNKFPPGNLASIYTQRAQREIRQAIRLSIDKTLYIEVKDPV
jgi:hypothetical protein